MVAQGPGHASDPNEAVRRLLARCRAIHGTQAERYPLAQRLARCRFAALRFHRELRYREGSTVRRWLRRAATEAIPVFILANLHPRHVSL